jgi:membrane protein YqaA with SNARE-associated domain
MKFLRNLYNRMGAKVHSKHAELFLGVVFFIEAIFFIPTDPILIFYCLERRTKAIRYATIATVSSVLGGLAGYSIGLLLWQTVGESIIHNPIINRVVTPKTFTYLCGLYHKNAWLAVMAAGFTPIPYKAATLSAGFCSIALTPFIIGSIISRGARFYLYAIVIKIWGEQMKYIVDRFFTLLVILTIVLIAAGIWFCKG